jgi:hypothetical protein
MKSALIAIAGAVIGGTLGHFAFGWILSKGYYGMILPGGLLGLGAGFGKTRSVWFAIGFGLAAVCLGLFTEWRYLPWVKDASLGHFLRHVTDLSPVTLLMIAAGGILGFWIPFRNVERPARQ